MSEAKNPTTIGTVEGVCIAVGDYDSDHFSFSRGSIPGSLGIIGACELAKRANMDVPKADILHAFREIRREHVDEEEKDEEMARYEERHRDDAIALVEEYRKSTGRMYPPVYRVKITVEASEVSADEAEAFFLSQ